MFSEPLFLMWIIKDYGFGVGVAVGSSPRFFSFGGSLDDDELLELSDESPVDSGASGCRFLRVGLPGSPSSKSIGMPAFAFVSLNKWAFTR